MGKEETIKIFLRMRPHRTPSRNYAVEKGFDFDMVRFHIDKNAAAGLINNTREDHAFKFQRVYDVAATQEEVFDGIARPAVLNVLEGYNSTVFAYGQTGSGKTYTITGGTASFAERGIIPRAVALIYEELKKQTAVEWTTRVSYLQIYNEKGSDLLNSGQDAKSIDELPRVTISEDADEVILRGLETHVSNGVEDALNLLFLGDTNRLYCETPMNQTSSRSHCIFTIALETKAPGSAVVRRSKLHLVDLAGSERVGKSGIEGKLLAEAAYINLSLHYLEQVITALGEKSEGRRDHIPYRNSFMTQVLRDSLGGNCKTVMVATCHSVDATIEETLSTCRFAQRVASVKQDARINEETDPKLLIRKLRQEILELKEELAMYRKGDQDDARTLPPDEEERCRTLVREYLANRDPDANLVGLQGEMARIFFCFRLMKDMVGAKPSPPVSGSSAPHPPQLAPPSPSDGGGALQRQLQALQQSVRQKDDEIRLLLNIIHKGKEPAPASDLMGMPSNSPAPSSAPKATHLRPSVPPPTPPPAPATPAVPPAPPAPVAPKSLEALCDPNLLQDRVTAYEAFRRSYHKYAAIEQSKSELRDFYARAKQLGSEVNDLSGRIAAVKGKVQHLRLDQAVTGQADPREAALFQELGGAKEEFRLKAQELQGLRTTIEHYQLMLEQSQKQLTRDFGQWYDALERQQPRATAPPPTAAAAAAAVPPAVPTAPAGSGTGELQRILQAREAARHR